MPMESHKTNIRESLRTAQPPPQRPALKTKSEICHAREKQKVRDVSKGGGGSPEERPYDVSRGQNRLVTLP